MYIYTERQKKLYKSYQIYNILNEPIGTKIIPRIK